MLPILVIVSLLAAVHGDPTRANFRSSRSGRIYGGRNATIEEYPYQVSLYFGGFICGGSIISERHVLTAAHCMPHQALVKYLKVRSGSSLKSNGTVHEVEEAAVHERHDMSQYGNPQYDVAVLRVKEPFEFDESRQPIELYGSEEKAMAGDKASITGWGKTESGYPDQLQVVEVPIISTELCDYAFRKTGGIGEGQICAALYGEGGKDACAGDSGGPLAIGGRLAGIVSYGEGCAEPYYPGVYTEIAYFRDWIDQHLMK